MNLKHTPQLAELLDETEVCTLPICAQLVRIDLHWSYYLSRAYNYVFRIVYAMLRLLHSVLLSCSAVLLVLGV